MVSLTIFYSRRWTCPGGLGERLLGEPYLPGSARICPGPLVEALTLFAGIMLFIWELRLYAPWSVLLLFAFVLGSHWWRKESARVIGFGTHNLGSSIRVLMPYLLAIVGAILSAGALLHSFKPISLKYGLTRFELYLGWGVFQQYLLNGYFARRFEAALPQARPFAIAIMTSAIFAAAHTPNAPLMVFSFVAGLVSVMAYLRLRNIYFLGLAHGIIGFVMIYSLPFSMRIGPGVAR